MNAIQVNEELLSDSEFVNSDVRRKELVELFDFEHRRVILGEGALAMIADECRQLGANSAFLVHDPALPQLVPVVQSNLSEGDIELVGTFSDIVPNPTVASVDALAAAVKAAECDAVVALGGGSTMDSAKVGLCVATAGGTTSDYFGFDLFPAPARWPLIAVPTTAGTGAEASRVSVVATAAGKQAVYSDYIQPPTAIVDPVMTRDMPPALTAITGLDAIGHALECTASDKSNELGDAVARESLKSGLCHLVSAIEEGAGSPEARYHMARASLLGGLLLSPINTGAAHALGYGIERLAYEKGSPVPHGTAVALVLPGVMLHNAPAVADKYYYAAGVAGQDLCGKSVEEGVALAAGFVDTVRRRHTAFGSLTASGLGEEDIPRMTEIAMAVRRLLDPNPVEVTPEDAERIYRDVLT